MCLIREVMFPDFFVDAAPAPHMLRHFTAVRLDSMHTELTAQIRRACRLAKNPADDAAAIAEDFVDALPELRRLLLHLLRQLLPRALRPGLG